MRVVFVDTFYFLAILNVRDPAHVRARDWVRTYSGTLVTSEWIWVELADAMSSTRHRGLFTSIRNQFAIGKLRRIVPFDNSIYEEAIQLYDARPDKKWSLTDCTSFAIMRREGLADALTADHHFEQAGYVPLLKPV